LKSMSWKRFSDDSMSESERELMKSSVTTELLACDNDEEYGTNGKSWFTVSNSAAEVCEVTLG